MTIPVSRETTVIGACHACQSSTCSCPPNTERHSSTLSAVRDGTVRIVCTTCPAVARTVFLDRELGFQRLVWVECHGQQFLGTLDGSTIRRFDHGRALVLEDIRPMTDAEVTELFVRCEREMLEFAEVTAVLQRFMKGESP